MKNWFRHHFPNPGLKDKREIVVSPKQSHSSYSAEIGTAFDYLFRFHLERTNKKTYKDKGYWVAEAGLKRLLVLIDSRKTKKISIGYYCEKQVDRLKFRKFVIEEFENAKKNHKMFINDGKLTKDLIKSSVILAKLDVVFRTLIIDSNFEEIEAEKIAELEELLKIVPWDNFKTKNHCLLNPTFGEGSSLVGGADADLILDSTLVDIKTNRQLKIVREDLNQIVGYCLLAIIGDLDIKIKTIGIYFARYGFLWQMPLTDYHKLEQLPILADEFKQLVGNRELNLIPNSTIKTSKSFQPIAEYIIDEKDFKCPFCESKYFIKHGKTLNKFRYKCKKCVKSFTSTIDTTASREFLKNIKWEEL